MNTVKDVKQADVTVQIMYTNNSRDFMSTEMMEALNDEEGLDKEYRLPTSKDLNEQYESVATFVFDDYTIAEHIEEQFQGHTMDTEEAKLNMILETLFMEFNHVDYEGMTEHMASQEYIRENKLHTSMSIGDVVRLNDKYFYVDGMGFVEFDPFR